MLTAQCQYCQRWNRLKKALSQLYFTQSLATLTLDTSPSTVAMISQAFAVAQSFGAISDSRISLGWFLERIFLASEEKLWLFPSPSAQPSGSQGPTSLRSTKILKIFSQSQPTFGAKWEAVHLAIFTPEHPSFCLEGNTSRRRRLLSFRPTFFSVFDFQRKPWFAFVASIMIRMAELCFQAGNFSNLELASSLSASVCNKYLGRPGEKLL